MLDAVIRRGDACRHVLLLPWKQGGLLGASALHRRACACKVETSFHSSACKVQCLACHPCSRQSQADVALNFHGNTCTCTSSVEWPWIERKSRREARQLAVEGSRLAISAGHKCPHKSCTRRMKPLDIAPVRAGWSAPCGSARPLKEERLTLVGPRSPAPICTEDAAAAQRPARSRSSIVQQARWCVDAHIGACKVVVAEGRSSRASRLMQAHDARRSWELSACRSRLNE